MAHVPLLQETRVTEFGNAAAQQSIAKCTIMSEGRWILVFPYFL